MTPRIVRMLALVSALLLTLAACSGGSAESVDDAASDASGAIGDVSEALSEAVEDPEAAASQAEAAVEGAPDVVTALEDAGLTGLAAAVETSGIQDTLQNLPEFTFFAPDNEALGAIAGDVATMNPAQLTDILRNHVVEQRILSGDLPDGETTVTTLAGQDLVVSNTGGQVTVGGAQVTQTDIQVGDTGVIHVIDAVLQPSG